MIGEMLDIIKRMDALKPWAIVDLIYEDWMYYGTIWQDREKGILELATGGWSGNESIIAALQENLMFWGMYWMESKRGGYYRFEGLK